MPVNDLDDESALHGGAIAPRAKNVSPRVQPDSSIRLPREFTHAAD
jgi:hypothetical protein